MAGKRPKAHDRNNVRTGRSMRVERTAGGVTPSGGVNKGITYMHAKIVPIEHARAQRLLNGLDRLERDGASIVPLKTTAGFSRAEDIVRAIKEALPVIGEDQTRRVCEATLRELCRSQR